METNGVNGVSGIGGGHERSDLAQQSQLSAASDARVAAAREAVTQNAILPADHSQQAQFTFEAANGAVAQPAQFAIPIPPEPTSQELAAMAQATYGTSPLPDGWGAASSEQLHEIGLNETMLSSPTSDFSVDVYVREFDGQMSYTIAFRGTTGSASDWSTNLRQGAGLPTDHYNRALEIGRRLTVPDGSRVTITGHSLGGGLASTAALASEIDAVTFNSAGLSTSTLNAAERIAAADGRIDIPDIRAYFVSGEVLSAIQDGGDRVFGAIFGGLAGGVLADAPEAVGERIRLDPIRPEDLSWYRDTPFARHQMDYVISSLAGN